jgi:hypothetical protein
LLSFNQIQLVEAFAELAGLGVLKEYRITQVEGRAVGREREHSVLL